jgi:hypothetical protein
MATLNIFLTMLSLAFSASPNPQDVIPKQGEFTVSNPQGTVKGSYQKLKLGNLLYQSGTSFSEEKDPGKVREWLYQAEEGTITVGNNQYSATCIRVSRFNTLLTNQPFYYEIRISALEGSCSEKPEKRLIEFIFQIDDFVLTKYRSGTLRFFGQNIELLLYPIILRPIDNVTAVKDDGGYFISGKLSVMPNASDLKIELLARPKGVMSCSKSSFNPENDAYSSFSANVLSSGKWGTTIPKLGGAVCIRLMGGGASSIVTNIPFPP